MLARMTVEQLLPDVESDTRPSHVSGVRRISSTGLVLADMAGDLITRLSNDKGRPFNELARRLIDEPTNGGPGLADCRASFASWPHAPPSAEVRAKILTQFANLNRAALDYLSGSSRYFGEERR